MFYSHLLIYSSQEELFLVFNSYSIIINSPLLLYLIYVNSQNCNMVIHKHLIIICFLLVSFNKCFSNISLLIMAFANVVFESTLPHLLNA